MKTFKTPKGTELPIMDLKGKDYLQVAFRVQWFREENQFGRIDTERISESDKHVTYRATISVPIGTDGVFIKLSNADKTLNVKQTIDYEKAETAAIGRALALAGYGTQFAEDITEGDDIADAPIDPKKQYIPPEKSPPPEGWSKDECTHKWYDDKFTIGYQYCASCKAKRKKQIGTDR